MYCTNCGKEVSDKAIACPGCGMALASPIPATATRGVSQTVIVLGYVFAVLFSLVGLILGIITLTKGNDTQRAHGIAITIISLVSMLIALAMLA